MKKWALRFFKLSFVLVIIGIGILLHVLLPKLIIDTKSTSLPYSTKTDRLNKNTETVHFNSFDSTVMQGLWGKTQSELRGTIILLHGIRGYKEYFAELTAQLNDSGYNTLALDLRAHGNSGGEYCTFGYHEKKDLKAAVDFLLSQPNADSTIGLWGQSLGGAIAYQALENDKRLKFGIIESTFSELKTIVHDYSERMFGFSISWVNKYALNRAASMADFIPNEVSPFASAANVTQPMLVAHGTKDRNINFDYGKANFDNLNSDNKTFLAIEGAGHNSLWQVGGEEYRQQVYQFLSSLR